MAFLKRIEAHGFKSFADPLKIDFNTNIVGVVGPNGSGKSNINDAIRWVLGEQSVKSLRGETSEDIIFNGASGKKPLNMAEVTLVFDNSNKIFPSPFNEIQITRRIFRNTSENEYYINKSKVRLKDVQNLVMDTGLSKGSLAIISQGHISKFADSKPEERRTLFEEAAGVAKYKKRKEESLRKLERTNENLLRVNDILEEIGKRIEPLAKQAKKAQEFIEIRDTLKQYEITILVKDGTSFQEDLSKISKDILVNQKTKNELKLKIDKQEQQLKLLKNQGYEADKQINSLEMNMANINSLLNVLEQQKKIVLEQQKEQSIKNPSKIKQLEKEVANIQQLIASKKQIEGNELNTLSNVKNQLQELELHQTDLTMAQNNLHHTLGQKKAQLNYLLSNHQRQNHKHQGTQTVLNNRSTLYGVVDTFANLIDIPELYHQAIGTVLGRNMQNIVTKTDQDASKAVNFLKNNRAGVATFLPLNTIRPKVISQEDKIVMETEPGFIACAHELVQPIISEHQKAIDFLLGRTVICENLESATKISKLLAAKYQCVTIDAQTIKAGGVIVGGFINENQSQIHFQKKDNQEEIKNEITLMEKELVDINVKLISFQKEIQLSRNDKIKLDMTILNLSNQVQELENNRQLLTTEYQNLTGKKMVLENDQVLNDIFTQYETNQYEKTKISQQLQSIRQQKHDLLEEMQEIDNELYNLHQDEYTVSNTVQQDKIKQVQLENKVEHILKRLAETYHLTFDYAKEIYQEPLEDEIEARKLVLKLRNDLEELGFVNLNAIEDYEAENNRYQDLKVKHNELTKAVDELMSAIDEMDELMVTKFDETIKSINKVLPETFQTLFGGGNCQLRYNNPDNILATGIEVLANPPGKKISNLNLLSGGEKSLVALAVLFAILKVKPLPLTILDEVEAPLDPANLERFARYVRSFSETTQFIIVTHRPGTMENCDVLYGTTMENQGVTKMVNIKLQDARKIMTKEENPI